MPRATGAAGRACQLAEKTVTRNHFCSKPRGAREETAAARIFQKHPLEKCNRCDLLKLTAEQAGWCQRFWPGSADAGGCKKNSARVKTLQFDSCLHHFLAL